MPSDDWDDEDAWADDSHQSDDEDAVRCPECGADVPAITDKCPACGYWTTEADRRASGSGMARPLWLRVMAAVVLAAFVFSLLAIGFALF